MDKGGKADAEARRRSSETGRTPQAVRRLEEVELASSKWNILRQLKDACQLTHWEAVTKFSFSTVAEESRLWLQLSTLPIWAENCGGQLGRNTILVLG